MITAWEAREVTTKYEAISSIDLLDYAIRQYADDGETSLVIKYLLPKGTENIDVIHAQDELNQILIDAGYIFKTVRHDGKVPFIEIRLNW